ncbi:MAG: hypothetical protein ACLTW9_00310 [Enterocloster sp.]
MKDDKAWKHRKVTGGQPGKERRSVCRDHGGEAAGGISDRNLNASPVVTAWPPDMDRDVLVQDA